MLLSSVFDKFVASDKHKSAYAIKSKYEWWPKAADCVSLAFVTAFFYTLFAWNQNGTLFESHPMTSLWLLYAAFMVQGASFIYKVKMQSAKNESILNFAETAVLALMQHVYTHFSDFLEKLIIVLWITSLVMKTSRHPDFRFFSDMSTAFFKYLIPGFFFNVKAVSYVIVLWLDYAAIMGSARTAPKRKN